MRYIALAGLVLLAGCAANRNERHVGLHDVPSSTVFGLQDPNGGDAMLTVVRAQGLWGGGCSSAIYVDDKVVADMEIGEQLALHVPAGARKLGMQPHGSCSGDRVDVDATVGQGESRTFTIPASGEGLTAEAAPKA
ncbi:hypothetical protein IM816_09800 [Luteibacter flocculans]|uniref:Uncharacterized protein n=1 Tax=Luteibacter flocculans TaxID=2780091 RepID=A0ABY4SW87_9GAMM|nr:hypothetical protein [Luteibacter flocculans]URL56963.1 hypothetical protein IM816_09800 [Luteibacter flocculans]